MNLRQQLYLFETTLVTDAKAYVAGLSPATAELLVAYYEILLRWNDRLHLVAPCPADIFATRHILESLLILSHLPNASTIADVGSGAGLPIIPCLIARDDLRATLIESSPKKTVFLREALKQIKRADAATIIPRPFEDVEPLRVSFVTCRALDQFSDKVDVLYKWAPPTSTLLLFGGKSLALRLQHIKASYSEDPIPNSDQRFLYVVNK